RQIAGRFSVLRVVAAQHRRDSSHDDRLAGFGWSRSGPQRERTLPALYAAVAVERAEHVVERDEVHGPLVDNRPANRVAPGSPAPFLPAVAGIQAVKELVGRSEIQPLVEREDLVRRTTQPVLPDGL